MEETKKGTGNEDVPEPENDENKLTTWVKDIVSTIGIALVVLLIIYMVPSESKHLSKANEYADEYASLVIKELKRVAAENKNPLYSVSDIIDDDDCLMIEKLFRDEIRKELEYKRHIVFSTGKVDDFRQIGFLGLVFNLTKVNEAEVEEDAVTIWNEIVEQSRKNELESALDFLSLFAHENAKENDEDNNQVILEGSIFESSTSVTMALSIDGNDSVSGVVTFTYDEIEDTQEEVVKTKVKGHIYNTSEPGWVRMEFQDEDGTVYLFDPFPKDFDDELAVQFGNSENPEIIYLKKKPT